MNKSKVYFVRTILIVLVIIFLFFNFPLSSSATSDENLFKYRKDPLLSGLFSFYIGGLGQVYADDFKRGTMFFVTENVLFWSAILNFSDLKFHLVEDFGFSIAFKQKEHLTKSRIYTSIGLGTLFLIVKVWDVVDAVDTAKQYNQKIFNKEIQKNSVDISNFSFGIEKDKAILCFSGYF